MLLNQCAGGCHFWVPLYSRHAQQDPLCHVPIYAVPVDALDEGPE